MEKMHDTMMKDDMTMKDDMKMKNDMMMDDDMMKQDDTTMADNTMMEDVIMPAAKTIKVWVGSKKMMVDGMQVSLKSMPTIHEGNTYVANTVISKYMMPMKAMK
jgi:hypothetical protein